MAVGEGMRAIWVLGLGLSGCLGVPDDLPFIDEVPISPNNRCAPSRIESVACVIDGDTIAVGDCSASIGERIRLLGTNAPETAKPDAPEECFGDEATVALRQLVEGATVRLTFDTNCRDIFGRTLAYIWLDESDGTSTMVNLWTLERGYARRYAEEGVEGVLVWERELDASAALAEAQGVGLYGVCDGGA